MFALRPQVWGYVCGERVIGTLGEELNSSRIPLSLCSMWVCCPPGSERPCHPSVLFRAPPVASRGRKASVVPQGTENQKINADEVFRFYVVQGRKPKAGCCCVSF